MSDQDRYTRIIEEIFREKYREGDRSVEFDRNDIIKAAKNLDIETPKNPGDVLYSFRHHRKPLPRIFTENAPQGMTWNIRLKGRSRYIFELLEDNPITPNKLMSETKIPDSTPGIIALYALSDEQALLAKVRYNRMIDIFTGVTCYSLQNHLRTTVKGIGQIETDEIYVGVDRRGAHYVFPVQAKSKDEKLSIVQIEQDFALCAEKFPHLICRVIGAQFIENDLIALFGFEKNEGTVRIVQEKHYRLVQPDSFSLEDDLDTYHNRSTDHWII